MKTIQAICICSPNMIHSRGFHQCSEIILVCSVDIWCTAITNHTRNNGTKQDDIYIAQSYKRVLNSMLYRPPDFRWHPLIWPQTRPPLAGYIIPKVAIAFHAQNLVSWFSGKLLKLLPPDVRQILTLKCTKSFLVWGSVPDPAGGANSAPQTP